MKILLGLAAVLLCGSLAACGGDGDIDAFVKLDTVKGEAFAVGGDDCVEKAKSVREWRTKHNAAYKAAQQKLKEKFKDGPPKDAEKYADQMKKNKKAVMSAMMKCSNTPEFSAAIDETK